MEQDAFARELTRRSPLAAAALAAMDFAMDDAAALDAVFAAHRGRCYEDVVRFPDLVRLLRDALLRHDGSGHGMYVELAERGAARRRSTRATSTASSPARRPRSAGRCWPRARRGSAS
jgi:hypothetical protein